MNLPSPLCGIDEAGRGPIAGPLVMAGVVLEKPIAGLDDSKKLSEEKRAMLFDLILQQSRAHHIVFIDSHDIDQHGLSWALRSGLESIQAHIEAKSYLFDGNHTFGASGIQTMVKADTCIPEVSAASILAKVSRDRFMVEMADRFPGYGFQSHKGYGTKAHLATIKQQGLCAIHRTSFTIRID